MHWLLSLIKLTHQLPTKTRQGRNYSPHVFAWQPFVYHRWLQQRAHKKILINFVDKFKMMMCCSSLVFLKRKFKKSWQRSLSLFHTVGLNITWKINIKNKTISIKLVDSKWFYADGNIPVVILPECNPKLFLVFLPFYILLAVFKV